MTRPYLPCIRFVGALLRLHGGREGGNPVGYLRARRATFGLRGDRQPWIIICYELQGLPSPANRLGHYLPPVTSRRFALGASGVCLVGENRTRSVPAL